MTKLALKTYLALQERLAELHLYEEINEHYAQCNISPEALRDWVAERADKPAQPVKPAIERNFCGRCGKRLGGDDYIHTCTPPIRTKEKNT
jgi:hypothetical protein